MEENENNLQIEGKRVVSKPPTQLEPSGRSSGVKLDSLDDEDIVVEEVNFSQICARHFPDFTQYEVDVIARTVVAYCRQVGMSTSPASGVVINDPQARGKFDIQCQILHRIGSLYEILNAALSHLATKKQVVAAYKTYDDFCRKAISFVGNDPVSDGQRLCVGTLPAVILKPVTEKPDHEVEQKMGRLALDVALVLTLKGVRTPLCLEFSAVDKDTKEVKVVRGIWTMADELVSVFTGTIS